MHKHIKQVFRQLLAVMLTAAFVSGGASTVFAGAIKLIPVDVDMAMNTYTNETTNVEVFWSDDWFEEPSTEYNHELAVTSIVLSSTAYVTGPDMVHSDSDMRRALLDFGFDEDSLACYNYDYPYTAEDNDVVAFTLASKQIDGDVLVAVIIRGTMDDYEWESDVRVSADPADYENVVEHYAFYQAESKIVPYLSAYIADLSESYGEITGDNIKFYITGHSRGGSVADILAAELTDSYGKDRVYAYTFAAPAVAVRGTESGYENIFNILNADDQVSGQPFTRLEFARFGVDKVIASPGVYDSQNDEAFMAHDPYVYYARLKSGLPDTLFE